MIRRMLLVIAAIALGVAGAGSPAAGDAPWRVGWWTVANLGIPQLVAFAPRLPPDDVPDGGFQVGGTTDAPTSYGALLYDVPRGATVGPLVLPLATGTTPTATPAAAVQACPLTGTGEFGTDDGGPMGDAPPFDCAHPAVGEIDPAGLTITFDVAPFVRDGVVAIAIVPIESAPIVFAPPGDSLPISQGRALEPAAPGPPLSQPTDGFGSGFSAPPSLEPPPAPTAVPPSRVPSPTVPLGASRPGPSPSPMGAGSAVLGSIAILAAGVVVLLRSRRTIHRVVGA